MIDEVHRFIVPTAFALLPPTMRSDRATAMLLAIGLQESRFLHRRQFHNGPARGFWMFERGGGITGVLQHERSQRDADRIVRLANLVGRERVIAGTDCGLGGRVHPDIAWAKLEALAQGAALASRQLY